jgi:hypothetical protein
MSRILTKSWLDTYLEYTNDQESPEMFHRWVGMCILSATVGRSIFLPRIKYTIYPNIYVILVAGSAKCKKSTSMNIGMDILKAMEKPPMVFAQKITTEALIQALELAKTTGQSAGIIFASELAVFLGHESKSTGIIPALTDLYDSPATWTYHTRGRGKEELTNVTLAMLAGTTKDWLKTSLPEESIGGGFTSRVIFVFQDNPRPRDLFGEGYDRMRETQLKANLVHDLNHIRANVKGLVEFTDEAKKVCRAWYDEELFEVRDQKLDGYFARKHDIMFKLATLLSVADRDDRVVTDTHVTEALKMMSANEDNLENVMNSITSNETGGYTEKILTLVYRHKRIKHSELLRRCWRFATAQEMSILIRTLVESGEIGETVDKENIRYYTIKANSTVSSTPEL